MKKILTLFSLFVVTNQLIAQLDSSTQVLINDQQWTGYEHSVMSPNKDLNLLIHGPYNSGITKMDSNFTYVKGVYYFENAPTQTAFHGVKLLQDTDSTLLVCGRHFGPTLNQGIIFSVDSTLETNWSFTYKPQTATSFEWTDATLLGNGNIFLTGKNNMQQGYLALSDANGGLIWSVELSDLVIPISCAMLNDTTVAVLANKMNANTTIAGALTMTVHTNTGQIIWQMENTGFGGKQIIVHEDTLYSLLDAFSSDLRLIIHAPGDVDGTMVLVSISSGFMLDRFQLAMNNGKLYILTGSQGVYDSKITVLNRTDWSYEQGNQLMNLRAMHFSDSGQEFVIGKGPVFGIKSSFNSDDHIGLIRTEDIDTLLQNHPCGFWSMNGTVTTGTYTATTPSISTSPSTFIVNPITLLADTVSPALYVGCVDATGSLNEFEVDLIEVMPNPSRGEVTVKNTSDQTINLIVLDQLGRTVQQTQMITPNSSIHLDLIKVGSYFMVTRDQQNRTQTEKLVVIE